MLAQSSFFGYNMANRFEIKLCDNSLELFLQKRKSIIGGIVIQFTRLGSK